MAENDFAAVVDDFAQVPEKTVYDRLLSPEDLAAYLGVSLATVYRWRARRTGPPGLRVGKNVRFRREVVERWLDEHAETTPEYHLDQLRAAVAESLAKQGLPTTVTDDLTLGRLAELFNGAAGQSEEWCYRFNLRHGRAPTTEELWLHAQGLRVLVKPGRKPRATTPRC